MSEPHRESVLVVEDDPGVAVLERRQLERAGYRVLQAETAEDALARLAEGAIDLVLLDYRLPEGINGLDFLARMRAAGHDLPVILVTGHSDEAAAIRALRAGIRDYITKTPEYLDYLPEAVNRVLATVRTERQLAESEARLKSVIRSARDAILVADEDHRITLFNAAAEQMFRCPAGKALALPVEHFIPADPGESPNNRLAWLARRGQRGRRADGDEFPLEASVSSTLVGGRMFYTIVIRDITERRRMEDALRQSEERFRAFMENTPTAAFMLDEQQRIVFVNRYWEEFAGRRLTAVQGKTPAEIWPDPAAHLIDAANRRVLATDQASEGFIDLPRPDDGVPRRWWVLRFPLRAPSGKRFLGGIAMDITERLQAEERMHEQAALLDKATDAIYVRAMDERILFWNKRAETLYGWTQAEAVGRNADELLYRQRPVELDEAVRVVLETGEWQGELRQLTRDGRELVVSSRWTLMRDTAGRPRAKLVLNTDITEKKKLEAQYLRAQRLESIGTLAGGIAHDLNNVLTPIVMAVDLLGPMLADPTGQGLLAMLRTSAERGAQMVKQVLSFARGVEGQRQPLGLEPLTAELGRLIRQTFPRSIEVRLNVPKDLWLVRADPTQIHQVLMNLCVNARDAMPEGGRLALTAANVTLDDNQARVHPDARPGQYVRLHVEDTGVGIPPAQLDRIFDPFFTTKEPGKGTGLGLPTVLGIVKGHGGFVTVYSEVGRGTRFGIYLPAMPAEAPRTKESAVPAIPGGNGELVLVIDDEAPIRAVTQAMLEACGYRVITAENGADGVAVYRQHRTDLRVVITDMIMPVLDGPATIRILRQVDPEVRIIAVSGFTSAGMGDDWATGIRAFLDKPFTAQQLAEAVHAALK